MTRLPADIFFQCVEELRYRQNEGNGSWKNGLPVCFEQARGVAGLSGSSFGWVAVVESIVKGQCLDIVSQMDRTLCDSLRIKIE